MPPTSNAPTLRRTAALLNTLNIINSKTGGVTCRGPDDDNVGCDQAVLCHTGRTLGRTKGGVNLELLDVYTYAHAKDRKHGRTPPCQVSARVSSPSPLRALVDH